ncbi:MAG TPA: histidine--tRNA ligase [Candidatus Avidehalobacter gallistercoris]|uniref:Histidine--tRNA ligase n=1 Tax=Candidatus Avidehalobacter gallistercoris TaxID=2840694 RepID=A0A9D1HKX5_9FIRM|nr:histidine--tRNA ligase [Candidatus Avidehalobacter gallistercoris]
MLTKRPRGTNDFLPEDTCKWQYVENLLREICHEFGYEEIRTPIFEETELFLRGVGDTTDIVQKEMYTFEDAGGRSVTLRPENTASAVRAYVENKMAYRSQPTKLFYIGPMFRYERPQAGRFRQFHQFGVECFGAASPAADAEIITLAWEFYHRLGLQNLELNLNSVGCPECRPAYRKALQDFLRPNLDKLCDSCRERFDKNPLRILDCKNPECQQYLVGAPTTLDALCDDCREHFNAVNKYLDAVGIPYKINERLVRGLDYYTNTAFEILLSDIGAQSAVCGGGRYNRLVEEIGGKSTPGVGFALGMERVFNALASQGIELPAGRKVDVFVAALDAEAGEESFRLTTELRRQGLAAAQDVMGRSLKAQFKYADKFAAAYTLIVGGDELARGAVQLRDMAAGEQQEVAIADVVSLICAKFHK